MTVPVVSVIIPTYKHRDFVLAAIESALGQTFARSEPGSVEVIVVNDGSPDDTATLLAPLAADGRIRYIEQANAGQSFARNVGIAAAQGEFLALLDDDDFWPADKLEWQVDALRRRPEAALVYGFTTYFGEACYDFPRPTAPSGNVYDAFVRYNWIRSPGQTLMRRAMVDALGKFDPAIWGADDWDLYLRLARTAPFVFEDRCALNYRLHPASASRDTRRMYANAMAVVHKHFGRVPRPRTARRWIAASVFVRWMIAGDLWDAADRHRQLGDPGEAARARQSAVMVWPPILRRSRWVGSWCRPIRRLTRRFARRLTFNGNRDT